MISYVIMLAQSVIIGIFIVVRRKEKRENKVYVQEMGVVAEQYVSLIHKNSDTEAVAETILKTLDELSVNFSVLETSYDISVKTILEKTTIVKEQSKLIEEQYEVIQEYDIKLESLKKKLSSFERLKIN